ncbi:hypothetical protein ACN9MB_10215 [Dyella kyungheensis]|jgi:hypothetical protein|uniref:hypothetical protein n=1 Tax=Dyella kyungheensis TaxID=1242174 RepID=UPI003CF40D97
MIEIVGVHRGVVYNANYVVDGEETNWRASFQRGEDTFSREGRLMHGWLDEADVRSRVHIAIQRYIENTLSEALSPAPDFLAGSKETKPNNQGAS